MTDDRITAAYVSQYRAALAMLRTTLLAYPADLWDHPIHTNRTWRIAYHVLFYTHLYLSPSEEEYERWEHAIDEARWLGNNPEPPFDEPVIPRTSTVDELIAYLDMIHAMVPDAVGTLPFDGESGFDWIPLTRFELHIYNIRHLQHHTAQLIERLRAHGHSGVDWVGRAHAAEEPA